MTNDSEFCSYAPRMMADTATICARYIVNVSVTCGELKENNKKVGLWVVGVGIMRTTKGGPHGHVHRARNFISESGLPCVFHAARKRHDAIPIDNHAIYTHAMQQASAHGRKRKRASVNR